MNRFTLLYYRIREPGVTYRFFDVTFPTALKVHDCYFCGGDPKRFIPEIEQNHLKTLRLERFDPGTGDSDLEVFNCCETCFPVCSKIVELFERSRK